MLGKRSYLSKKIIYSVFALTSIVNAILIFWGGTVSPEELHYICYSNLSYGDYARNKIDIYMPVDAGESPRPAIVFMPGGGWIIGSKSRIHTYGKEILSFVDKGYVVVSMNYRLLPSADYLDMLQDINKAMLYIQDNSNQYNIDDNKIAIAAYSAGSHLGMLYAYSDLIEDAVDISLVMNFVGPTDFTDKSYINSDSKMAFTAQRLIINLLTEKNLSNENIDEWREASPVYYINEDTPPSIMAYGEKDNIVSYTNGEILYDKLQENGVYSKLIVFPNSGHQLDKDEDKMQLMMEECERALDMYLPIGLS